MYAMRTTHAPTLERAANGCPATGWCHEAHPPWRVIVADTPHEIAEAFGQRPQAWYLDSHPDWQPDPAMWPEEYTGDEDPLTVAEWLDQANPNRSTVL